MKGGDTELQLINSHVLLEARDKDGCVISIEEKLSKARRGKSLMKSRKRRGENILPCGTPAVITKSAEVGK